MHQRPSGADEVQKPNICSSVGILRDAEGPVTDFHDLLSLLCPDFRVPW